jgi:hypothetical protein
VTSPAKTKAGISSLRVERHVGGFFYPDGICVLHTEQKRDDELTLDVGTFLLFPKKQEGQ